MALKGTLKDFGLPDIVQLIGLQRKTGTLHLKTEGESVNVVFDGGNIVAGQSSTSRPSDRIGSTLVTQGAITSEQLDRGLSIQKQTMQRLGHILVSEKIISEDTLRRAVEAQLFQVVFRLFRWRQGEYNFETQNTVDYERMGAVPLGADFVLMEGIRMVDEWPIIERRIPSMASVFKRTVEQNQVGARGSEEAGPDGPSSGLGDAYGPGKLALSPTSCWFSTRSTAGRPASRSSNRPRFTILRSAGLSSISWTAMWWLSPASRVRSPASSPTTQAAPPALRSWPWPYWRRSSGSTETSPRPFGVFGLPPLIQPAVNTASNIRLLERLEIADARIRGFRLVYGRLPSSMDELVSEGLATKSSVFGLTLTSSRTGYALEASGPEGPVKIDRVFGIRSVPVPEASAASPAGSKAPPLARASKK